MVGPIAIETLSFWYPIIGTSDNRVAAAVGLNTRETVVCKPSVHFCSALPVALAKIALEAAIEVVSNVMELNTSMLGR